jgi:Zn finger protein HypA/HybF involved in hydrogenase expression
MTPKRRVPRAVLEEYKEKKAREEFNEQLAGYMEIECPHCHHSSKMKIGPIMFCPKCARKF